MIIYYTTLFNKYYYTYLFSQKFVHMSHCDILKTFQHHVENYVEKMPLLKNSSRNELFNIYLYSVYYITCLICISWLIQINNNMRYKDIK